MDDLIDTETPPEGAVQMDPVSIIRSLAWAGTPSEAVRRMPSHMRKGLAPDAAASAVRASAQLAAGLVHRSTLLPPAAAAYLAESGLEQSELQVIRRRAEQLLEAFLAGEPNVPESTSDEDRRTAFYYAAALLKQKRALAAIEQARVDAPTLDGAITGMDRERVTSYLLNRSMGGIVETLDRLVSSWQRLVDDIEQNDESLTPDDFEQSLIARDAIAGAGTLMTPDTRAAICAEVDPLDKRFLASTVPVSTPFRPPTPWRPLPWWWFQRPRRSSERFAG